MAIARLIPLNEEAETYRGVPVLTMHDGDPIPTPRAPLRYAVRVSPELARYLLSFNHPYNRGIKNRKIRSMAIDMAAGRWMLTPQGPVFSNVPYLINGQNTLLAISESGVAIWLVVDFGWPDEIIRVFDHGSSRTTQDTLRVAEVKNNAGVAAAYTKYWQYKYMVGTPLSGSGAPVPSAMAVLGATAGNEEWQKAVQQGSRLYMSLSQGGTASAWSAAYYLFAEAHSDLAAKFFDELVDQTGEPGSATRDFAKWFMRRPYTMTKTGDQREPLELIVRTFNAWRLGKKLAFPKWKGFILSAVRA